MEKKKLPEIQITELFLVKADWTRTFIGTIRREVDEDGNPVLMGEVIVQVDISVMLTPKTAILTPL